MVDKPLVGLHWCTGARSPYVAYYIQDQMTHPRLYHRANLDQANLVLPTPLLFMISIAGLSYALV